MDLVIPSCGIWAMAIHKVSLADHCSHIVRAFPVEHNVMPKKPFPLLLRGEMSVMKSTFSGGPWHVIGACAPYGPLGDGPGALCMGASGSGPPRGRSGATSYKGGGGGAGTWLAVCGRWLNRGSGGGGGGGKFSFAIVSGDQLFLQGVGAQWGRVGGTGGGGCAARSSNPERALMPKGLGCVTDFLPQSMHLCWFAEQKGHSVKSR